MKSLFLFILLFLLAVTPALAVDSSKSADKRQLEEEFREEKKQFQLDLKTERKASLSALMAEKKENFRQIRDEKKRMVAEKLSDKVIRINSTRVAHLEETIAKLEGILARIDAKSTELAKQGKDTTELDKAIDQASADLAAASLAIEAQSQKTYTFDTTSESNLRNEAGKMVSEMQSDLRTTLDAINKAKKSVHNALTVLKRTFGGRLPKVTGTPTSTPSAVPTI